jgi:hypothetical protein
MQTEDDQVRDDVELESWRRELAGWRGKPVDLGGVGVKIRARWRP